MKIEVIFWAWFGLTSAVMLYKVVRLIIEAQKDNRGSRKGLKQNQVKSFRQIAQ